MHFGGTYCLMPSQEEKKPLSMPTSEKKDQPAAAAASKPSKPSSPEILQAPPMPPQLTWLINRMVTRNIYSDDLRPQYCIVNRYVANLGISAHTEKFAFAEPVVGLSLLDACSMRFHELVEPCDGSVRSGKAGRAKRTGRRVDVWLPGRSLLVMREQARWGWQHEILRSAKGRRVGFERVSLTFRVKVGKQTMS